MLSAENIRWHGQSLWGLDAGKSVLTKYDFTSSGCSIVPQKVINMDADMLRVLDFVMVDDFTFIVPDESGSSRFCWVNYQGKLLRRTGQIPSANVEALQNAVLHWLRHGVASSTIIPEMECWQQLPSWAKYLKSLI